MTINNIAQKIYQTDGNDPGLRIPRHKYNFTLVLHRSGGSSIPFRQVAGVTLPNYSFENQQLNQYNRRRTIQTRLNYGNLSVNFYDTYDNAWQNIMNDYIKHYYNDGEGLDERRNEMSNHDDTTIQFYTTKLGFIQNKTRHFFTHVSVVQNGYRNGYREVIMKYPIITEINSDTLIYSDSSPVNYTVTFQPEFIQIANRSGAYTENRNITDVNYSPSLNNRRGLLG